MNSILIIIPWGNRFKQRGRTHSEIFFFSWKKYVISNYRIFKSFRSWVSKFCKKSGNTLKRSKMILLGTNPDISCKVYPFSQRSGIQNMSQNEPQDEAGESNPRWRGLDLYNFRYRIWKVPTERQGMGWPRTENISRGYGDPTTIFWIQNMCQANGNDLQNISCEYEHIKIKSQKS